MSGSAATTFFCPRAHLIFKGYCDQYGIDVAPCSSALSGKDDQLAALNHQLPLTLRESVCMLHEIEKSRLDSQRWFDTRRLDEKLQQAL